MLAAVIGSAALVQDSPASAPVLAYEAVESASLADREGPRRNIHEDSRRDVSVAAAAEPAAPQPAVEAATPSIVAVELLPEPRPVVASSATVAARALPDTRELVAKHRRDVQHARGTLNELERGLSTIDSSIAALTASATQADADAQAIAAVEGPESEAVARAQSFYNEAIARERRAATLAAHGVPARQELEAAQMQVRDAAAALSAARRAADQVAALAAAKALQARAQAEIALAQEQQRRAEQVTQITEAQRTLREAEEALAAAAAGK